MHPLRIAATASGNSSTPSVDVTSVIGDLVFDVVGHSNTGTASAGVRQTQRWSRNSLATYKGFGSTEIAEVTPTTMS